MPSHPPKGYRAMQYPLHHEFKYSFALHGESETKNSTIMTLLNTSRDSGAVEDVEVNPAHANFVEDTGPRIFLGSIVPRLAVKMTANITGGAAYAATHPMKQIMLNWMPIYIAFRESLTAEDGDTGTKIEEILELTKDTVNEDVTPLFAAVTMTETGDQPLSNIVAPGDAFGDWNLDTTDLSEPVAFDKQLYFDAMKYYSNKGMLRKVAPRMNTVRLHAERGWSFFSNNFTNPIVKRGNPYTFCGILFHLPQINILSVDQIGSAVDVTDIPHVQVKLHCRFEEWNPEFDQSAK